MTSKVFFIKASLDEGPEVISEKAVKLFKAGKFADCFAEKDYTAVKIHVGEAGNTTYIKPPCIKGLVGELLKLKAKPFLTDTSTLYGGRRHNAIDHTILAHEHGFCFEKLGAPFIAPDGLFGNAELPVRINCEMNEEVFIASDIVNCQSIISIAHFTGHCEACAAATIKTLGMGCANRKGKMRQHAVLEFEINNSCQSCGDCLKHCPADAITIDQVKAHIDQDKCIGCAECIAVCRFDAVKHKKDVSKEMLQKNIAEHALGAIKDKERKAAFFNYAISITKDCDCFSTPDMKNIVDDIGILASTDPVAVDKAAADMIEAKGRRNLAQLLKNDTLNQSHQFDHAERIGLGSTKYEIVEIE
ncbi:DUF362 domain-containing protein [Planctomycetota bacterium]